MRAVIGAVTRLDTPEQLPMQSLPVSPLHGALWDLETGASLEIGRLENVNKGTTFCVFYQTYKPSPLRFFVLFCFVLFLKLITNLKIVTCFVFYRKLSGMSTISTTSTISDVSSQASVSTVLFCLSFCCKNWKKKWHRKLIYIHGPVYVVHKLKNNFSEYTAILQSSCSIYFALFMLPTAAVKIKHMHMFVFSVGLCTMYIKLNFTNWKKKKKKGANGYATFTVFNAAVI